MVHGDLSWFAVQTKPRHEKTVAAQLEQKGVTVFLPLWNSIRQWSDRKCELALPLFSTYLFVQLGPARDERIPVLRTNGIVRFVGMQGGTRIPDEQIESLKILLEAEVHFEQYPYARVGQTVRIRGGSLDGVHGTLVGINEDRSLMVSIEAIQRSLSIRLDGYAVEPI